MKNVNFVDTKMLSVMNILEKREYIHSHLHQIDEEMVNEVFEKMFSLIEEEDPIIGYDVQSGEPISKTAYRSELERRDGEIGAGDYVLHEDVKKQSDNW